MKLDGFHFALIAIVVLLAIYFGSGFVREAMTWKEVNEQRAKKAEQPLTPAGTAQCGGFCPTGSFTSPEGKRGCFKHCKYGGRWGGGGDAYCCNPYNLPELRSDVRWKL